MNSIRTLAVAALIAALGMIASACATAPAPGSEVGNPDVDDISTPVDNPAVAGPSGETGWTEVDRYNDGGSAPISIFKLNDRIVLVILGTAKLASKESTFYLSRANGDGVAMIALEPLGADEEAAIAACAEPFSDVRWPGFVGCRADGKLRVHNGTDLVVIDMLVETPPEETFSLVPAETETATPQQELRVNEGGFRYESLPFTVPLTIRNQSNEFVPADSFPGAHGE